MKVLISIHDVMPDSLDDVLRLVEFMDSRSVPPVPLLVTCGLDWKPAQVGTLRELAGKGHMLSAHGWTHQARDIRGAGHRLHALLISRDQAEHLALSAEETAQTLRRCFGWFEEHSLPPPSMYVPPAWGTGRIGRRHMRESPFRLFETLTGIFDAETGRFRRLPLAGFQADTALRKHSLSALNAANIALARLTCLPVRLAVHPGDLDLRLADPLRRLLESPFERLDPLELF
jgi:hypothetical protein